MLVPGRQEVSVTRARLRRGNTEVLRPEAPTLPTTVQFNTKPRVTPNNGNEISIIQTVEHNRHGDVVLQRRGRNALTISCQQAYDKCPIALVSHRVIVRIRGFSLV